MKTAFEKAMRAWMKDLGKLGGLARAKSLTKAQRLAISRKANAAKKAKRKARA